MQSLERLSVSGFRSIKELDNLEFGPITVFLGANGSGKSNLVGLFRLLNYLVNGGLQVFWGKGGGASNFLHFGPGKTSSIDFRASFRLATGMSEYHGTMVFAAIDRLIFAQEEFRFLRSDSTEPQVIQIQNDFPSESSLSRDLHPTRELTQIVIRSFLGRIRVFHFHDTSATSRMRNYCESADNLYLRDDGGNLPAVLLRIRQQFPGNYRRIVAGVNTIFPEFSDFRLETTGNGPGSLLLRWQPTSNPTEVFTPEHLSDGTLRMMALVTLFNLPDEMAPGSIILDEPELGLHPAAEVYLASLIRGASVKRQVILSTQSATLVDQFKPSEIVVVEMEEGCSRYRRLDENQLNPWLKRYTLGEVWRKNIFGGRPE